MPSLETPSSVKHPVGPRPLSARSALWHDRRMLRALAIVLGLAVWLLAPRLARASTWTGPRLAVVLAEHFERVPCPAGQLAVKGTRVAWLVGSERSCLRARGMRLVEQHSAWAPATNRAFIEGLGKDIYVATEAPPPTRPQLVLLELAPLYEGKLAIVGAKIRARLVSQGEDLYQAEGGVQLRTNDDPLSLFQDWSRFRVGRLAQGPEETVKLQLIVRRSCLPGPIDIAACATHAHLERQVGKRSFQTKQVGGTLQLNSTATGPLDGLLEVDASAKNGGSYRFRARFVAGRIDVLQGIPEPSPAGL
jgi:hypothetical protein